jgi:hypothetical protein
MVNIQYLTDQEGKQKAVVIPIELWQKIMPDPGDNWENLAESLEDYCLNQAMNEAETTPLLDRKAALTFLEEE